MSNAFHLVCPATRQSVWVGQGWEALSTFYSGEAAHMEQLGRFLEATRGHLLILMAQPEGHGCLEDFESGQAGQVAAWNDADLVEQTLHAMHER